MVLLLRCFRLALKDAFDKIDARVALTVEELALTFMPDVLFFCIPVCAACTHTVASALGLLVSVARIYGYACLQKGAYMLVSTPKGAKFHFTRRVGHSGIGYLKVG